MITIRKSKLSDAGGIANVHMVTWLTTYRGIIPDERLDKLNCQDGKKKWTRNIQNSLEGNEILLVAESDNKIVGFCGGSKNDHPETYEKYEDDLRVLYILKEYQKHGIGFKLVSEYVKLLKSENINSMIIWVLEDNNYKAFYEKLGGIKVAEKTYNFGKELNAIGYGWENLDDFE